MVGFDKYLFVFQILILIGFIIGSVCIFLKKIEILGFYVLAIFNGLYIPILLGMIYTIFTKSGGKIFESNYLVAFILFLLLLVVYIFVIVILITTSLKYVYNKFESTTGEPIELTDDIKYKIKQFKIKYISSFGLSLLFFIGLQWININDYNFQGLSSIISILLICFIFYLLASSIYNYIKIIRPIISLKYKINISPKFVGEVNSELKKGVQNDEVPEIVNNTILKKEQTENTLPNITPTEKIITMKDVGSIITEPAPTTTPPPINIFKSLVDTTNKLNYNNYKSVPEPLETFQTFSYSNYNTE
jgi:hypothetical protein